MSNPTRQPLAVTSINAIISHPSASGARYTKPSVRPVASNVQPLKRKADEEIYNEEISDDDSHMIITDNCDQVRRKINLFLQTGEMKVGRFQEALGVNSKGFNSFLQQSGKMKGVNSNTYLAAHKFFKKREAQGIKILTKKIKKGEEKNDDVSAIKLDGEENMNLPVWETCDEVRKKISAYLRGPGVTQAGFLREIAKTYPQPKKIQSKVLNDFLGKKGPYAGNTSSVFYSSYVFFEKLRLRDNKPKSKHRTEMEALHPGGFDTKHRHDGGYWAMAGESIYEDKYGMIHTHR